MVLIMADELVKIDHMTKKYDENTIREDLSLTIHEGEVVVIVGPSGCGKSTLLRCINGLEPIQGGSITFRGESIDGKGMFMSNERRDSGLWSVVSGYLSGGTVS